MQQRSEETRTHIMEAANHLFSKNGYDATGVAEICQAAGVSKGAFYHHYPSKQALFLAIMDNWMNALEAGFSISRQETLDVPEAILHMAELVGGVFQTADVRLSILMEFWVQAYREPAIWQAAIAPYRHFQSFFADLIRAGIAEGSLHPVNPEDASRALVSMAVGLLMQALFDPQGADWQQETKQNLELLLYGLVRRDDK